jgi:hypothetical protein
MESLLIRWGYAAVFLFGFIEARSAATSVRDVG